jgi:hypothetical protein
MWQCGRMFKAQCIIPWNLLYFMFHVSAVISGAFQVTELTRTKKSFHMLRFKPLLLITKWLFCQIYSMAFSSQADYTDWATANSRGILVPTFVDRGGVAWSAPRNPRGRQSHFSRLKLLFFLLRSSSFILKRLSGPRSRPTATQKMW